MDTGPSARFSRFAWGLLAYNVAVIVWGAFVRATGSGAGCGSHWPLCNGAVVPRDPGAATMIEFTHRITSGLALIGVLALVWWAFRIFPKGHLVRRVALVSLVLILVEALLGAGLVLLDYVEQNKSLGRAVYLCAHLTNTLLLVGALSSVAWLSAHPAATWSGGPMRRAIRAGFVVALLAGITGALAALGDTLFPAISLSEGLRADLATDSHALLRLRLLHPVVAALGGCYLLWLAPTLMRRTAVSAGRALLVVTLVQLAAGLINVLLLAPVWMQLLHLFLGNMLWISLVLAWFQDGESKLRV